MVKETFPDQVHYYFEGYNHFQCATVPKADRTEKFCHIHTV